MAAIQFTNVSKRYDSGQEALRSVDFTLESGEMAFLTGHSGAGKSTLLKLLTRVEQPSRGDVWVGDQNLSELSRSEIPQYRRTLGVVYQNHRLLEDRTVYQNIALPLRIAGYNEEDIGRRVRAALDRVGLLESEQKLPQALSSGEQQRIGIARAIVHKPRVLIADEPTGNLDPRLSLDIMSLFEQFNRIGTTVLIATHDVALIKRMRHRVLILDKGRLRHVQ
ncbi:MULTISPECIES: cell division ATP-binding protein FtsE [unclassified Marinobacterium]|jgi:cell division transport system ATP-binding protein|uniref:cell division ATP-binding protein FtsE n=1 Tax=unclassified Marinobacterium TaxID=2644139 RepID=UPI001569E46A|nr:MULTISPECIES: cell division ATP-binding protein FtsE [unclassified Marinobacterium]NRP10841.1 Cell division ATP-binding protein FtsE [Marinobacterium sp. xm-g-48]NRP14878.1 Cell division ATP-binding protein FtsE [Marinobacterium sp. xm-a-152]NRP38608.1 Cell division ATP-binding protein FtsE [Marinobacterium sp. xm-a-121]NRP46662.1 Cell division ATP-binding protein FtsE [Marinobacterium sp. xm-d-543]NRP59295.1 Cell division ATP-binding protein FtsE [Marinobacterium sp. xm-d-564]